MKRSMVSLLVVLFLPLTGARALAQAGSGEREADHAALRAMRETIAASVTALDAGALGQVLAPHFSITMVDQTRITSVDGLKGYFDRLFRSEGALLSGVRVEPEADELTVFLGDTSAVNTGTSRDTYTLRRGGEVTLNSRWTGTFTKVDGQWKVAALHAGVNMLDNPILSMAESMRIWWGAGGLLIGVVVGALVRRRPKA